MPRKPRNTLVVKNNLDASLSLRLSAATLASLSEFASNEGYRNNSDALRNIIDAYLKSYSRTYVANGGFPDSSFAIDNASLVTKRDNLLALRNLANQILAVGRNLNQAVKALNVTALDNGDVFKDARLVSDYASDTTDLYREIRLCIALVKSDV